MRILARILLGLALAAPAVAAWASPGMRVQQTVQARVAHRVVQQQNEALQRRGDLRRAAEQKERETATTPEPTSPRKP